MTIPMLVMIISAVFWLAAVAPAENVPWWRQWSIDASRILFAASALVVLWNVAGKAVL
jgi:hypothetical protein